MQTGKLAVLLGLLVLTACNTVTTKEANRSFSEDIQRKGGNPYINAAAVRDLEQRMQRIAAQDAFTTDGTRFDKRNDLILSSFKDRYDHGKLLNWISLSRQGFETALLTLYGQIIDDGVSNCRVDANQAYFPNDKDKRTSYRWIEYEGACVNGEANGLGIVVSERRTELFAGWFERGRMVEGVFESTPGDETRVLQIGGVPYPGRSARLLTSIYRVNGFASHRYADFNASGHFDGFGINVFNYTDRMIVRAIGDFERNKLKGFGAMQIRRKNEFGASIWHAWMGTYRDGKLNGLGAWTNAQDRVIVGEWRGGQLNGVAYRQYSDITGDYHAFSVGKYRNGKRHGAFRELRSNTFNSGQYADTVYQNGKLVNDSTDHGVNFGQIFALATGAAVLSAANIPDAARIQIGTALTQDVLGNTGGSNLQALKQNFSRQNSGAGSASSSARQSTGSGSSGVKFHNATIFCPETKTRETIRIPYKTDRCLSAATDFARTYACNRLDQARVVRQCQNACGHPQCREQ